MHNAKPAHEAAAEGPNAGYYSKGGDAGRTYRLAVWLLVRTHRWGSPIVSTRDLLRCSPVHHVGLAEPALRTLAAAGVLKVWLQGRRRWVEVDTAALSGWLDAQPQWLLLDLHRRRKPRGGTHAGQVGAGGDAGAAYLAALRG